MAIDATTRATPLYSADAMRLRLRPPVLLGAWRAGMSGSKADPFCVVCRKPIGADAWRYRRSTGELHVECDQRRRSQALEPLRGNDVSVDRRPR